MRGRAGTERPVSRSLACWLVWAGLALSCQSPAPPPSKLPPNVVLLVVDTLRADHLSAYGYARSTSPNLDRWVEGGVLWSQARSQASCTFPSVNSLLTSRDPMVFLGQPDGSMGLPEGIVSLPELLAGAGYRTLAISASPVVRKSPTRFNPHGGFERGFEVFDEQCLWKSADCLNARVEALLPTLIEPYFLYLHYMEPHGPYRPPATHQPRFSRPFTAPQHILDGDPNPIADALYKQSKPSPASPRELEHLVDLYDEEISYFDSELPRLWAAVERQTGERGTAWVLAADHGEGFLEHGDIKHCRTPYDEQVKTPLLLRLPSGGAGARLPHAVSNLDIAPTVLELVGLPPPPTFEGKSLLSLLTSPGLAEAHRRLSFSSQGAARTVTDGRFKLIYDLEQKTARLFDLAVDPRERVDVSGSRPEDLRRLTRRLYERLVAVEGSASPRRSLELGEAAERRLKALGYLQ